LRDKQQIDLFFGNIIQNSDGTFHEKGVDLKIGLDMLTMAQSNQYDIAYLISSDNDLLPAVEQCIATGKEICYVGSSLKPSFGLLKKCSKRILLQKKDVEQYMPLQLPL